MIQIENLKSVPSQTAGRAIVVLGLLTIALLSIFVNPDHVAFLTCQFRELTGYPCPSCGLSHSFWAMSHFHIQESIKYHPIGPFVYFTLIFFLLKFSVELVFKKEIKISLSSRITKISLIIVSFAWLSYWIIRLMRQS